jgi:DNA-binding transcriptional ArsR family regulator
MQGAKRKTRKKDESDAVWRALASPARRDILDILHKGPVTTGALADHFPKLTRFAVMQHLRVLECAELVVARREGRERYNYLNPVPIQKLYDRWVARYMKPWTEALMNLKSELESEGHDKRA